MIRSSNREMVKKSSIRVQNRLDETCKGYLLLYDRAYSNVIHIYIMSTLYVHWYC